MITNDIIQELRELESSLCDMPARDIYAVPTGYFEGFASFVLSRIKALSSTNPQEELNHLYPALNSISKKLPYSVPSGYFNELSESLMAGIRDHEDYQTADEELSTLSPLLSGIGKQNPYSVPQGYFEDFGKDVNLNSDTRTVARTVSMVNRKWFRFAAAAIVIGFIAITGISLFFNKTVSVSNTHEWVKQNLKKVSTDDINIFIQTAEEESSQHSIVTTAPKTTDINDLMKDVSDKDIQEFLNKTNASTEDSDADILLN